ncbi:MAG: hypothetical protein ACI4P4_03080, partial [Faecousia sp.]
GAAQFGCLDANGKAPAISGRIKSGQQRMAVGRENFIFFHCPLDGERFKADEVASYIPIKVLLLSELI